MNKAVSALRTGACLIRLLSMPSGSGTHFMLNQPVPVDDCRQLDAWGAITGWQTDYQQVGRGKLDGRLTVGFQGDVQVNRCIYNRELLIHASPPKGMLSLVVPYSPGRRGLIQGRELEHAELVVVPCGAEGFLRTAKEIAYFVIMIPQVRMLELMKMNDPEAEGLNGSNEKRTGAAREGGAKCLSWKLTFGTADRALFPRQAAHHRVGCVPRLPRSA